MLLVNLPCYGQANAVRTRFVAFSISSQPPKKKIAASRKQLVHKGITLNNLVNTFGPAWMSPLEGIGICHWFFDDGSVLYVLALDYNPNDVLAFDRTKQSYMWWSTKAASTPFMLSSLSVQPWHPFVEMPSAWDAFKIAR